MQKDATGRDIDKGSYVVYAVTGYGDQAGLKFGVVVKLKEKATTTNVWDPNTRTYNSQPHTEYKIQVISTERLYNHQNQTWRWQIQGKSEGKLARVQTLDRLDRVIVLHPDQVHPEAREALDKELHERGQL